MGHLNVEIKAKSANHDFVRRYLKDHKSDFKGIDHQVDTYFKVPAGRLKLREGSIENNLIYYRRGDQAGPKQSHIDYCEVAPGSQLKMVLTNALGVLVVVDKYREIYFIENVKFHIDKVDGLGEFVEIEAIDYEDTIGLDKLREQCDFYMEELGIRSEDLLANSYSDMLFEN